MGIGAARGASEPKFHTYSSKVSPIVAQYTSSTHAVSCAGLEAAARDSTAAAAAASACTSTPLEASFRFGSPFCKVRYQHIRHVMLYDFRATILSALSRCVQHIRTIRTIRTIDLATALIAFPYVRFKGNQLQVLWSGYS